MATPKILIIGAGLSGLVLAQGLSHRGIPFAVYERDSSLSHRSQGYRFSLEETGADALKETITPELWDLFEKTRPKMMNSAVPLFDARTGEVHQPGRGGGGRRYPVDRTWVRELLCVGIKDSIHFGKAYESHEEVAGGGIKVHFADGSSSAGILLVAGDGIRSKLRHELLPEHKLVDVERLAIYGKTTITPEFLAKFPVEAQGIHAGIMDRQHPARCVVISPVDWEDRDISTISNGKMTARPNYMYWAMSSEIPPNVSDIVSRNATDEARKAYTLQVAQDWTPGFRTVLELQNPAITYAIRIVSSRPEIPPWEPIPYVTFMGDAVHPMSPGGGTGGITAIKDAGALCKAIAENIGKGQEAMGKGIRQYEVEMRERAKGAIMASFGGGKMLWGGKDWWDYNEVES